MKLTLLALCFFITALFYASAGFGGGSTYTALLVISGLDYRLIPILSLSCNLIVVSGNLISYGRAGYILWPQIWPLIILSVPAAWLGGRFNVSQEIFIGLLALGLFIAAIRLIIPPRDAKMTVTKRHMPKAIMAILGAIIGFYAGLVGIGGGIFLAPLLYIIGWGPDDSKAKHIAATASLFIFVNSAAGIAGQFSKLESMALLSHALSFWPLLPAVMLGGFIGNHIGLFKLSEIWLKRITGILILIVAARLTVKWLDLIWVL